MFHDSLSDIFFKFCAIMGQKSPFGAIWAQFGQTITQLVLTALEIFRNILA